MRSSFQYQLVTGAGVLAVLGTFLSLELVMMEAQDPMVMKVALAEQVAG